MVEIRLNVGIITVILGYLFSITATYSKKDSHSVPSNADFNSS